ncbi:MAG TPA: glycosyltransferase family 4 protein [Gammaproteobacteria bacterium]
MNVLLYRPRLSLTSGAGQLIEMQARRLAAAGERVQVAGGRGALEFFLRTGIRARRLSPRGAERRAALAGRAEIIVDHGAVLAAADVTFVHNFFTEASRFVARPEWAEDVAREAVFFRALRTTTPIVANSELVRAALMRHFALEPKRIVVHYPGYRAAVFTPAAAARLRPRARADLGLDDTVPVIGLVTSGDFQKRGLDVFLDTAERIAATVPSARFLVVGSRRLPDEALRHALVRAGRVLYRPKNRQPEKWLAALDVLLHTARFEEFGIVVSEAQALGVPVLTSRRVGAAECLPPEYTPWLIDAPSAEAFAAKAVALLGDRDARRTLSAAGAASVARFDDRSYARAAVDTILAQKR